MNQLLRRTNWPNLDGVPIRKLTSRVICTFPKSLSSSTRASPAQLSSSLFQLNSVTSSYTVPCCSWSSCWCGVCPILALLLDWSDFFSSNRQLIMILPILVLSPVPPTKRSISRSRPPIFIPHPASIFTLISHPAKPMLGPHKRTHVCKGYQYYLYSTDIVRVKRCSLQIVQSINYCLSPKSCY